MLLHVQPGANAPYLTVHVTDFASPLARQRWVRDARAELADVDALVFAKAMSFIGSRRREGFGAGVPALGRQVLLTAWQSADGCVGFAQTELSRRLSEQRYSWSALFDVISTRGSHYGAKPLGAGQAADGPFAALTLGRTGPRMLPRFLAEGARLGAFTLGAPGLIAAWSAGNPLTGNCTVSLWHSEKDMTTFAYGVRLGHLHAVRHHPPILIEQLTARLALRELRGDWDPAGRFADAMSQLSAEPR